MREEKTDEWGRIDRSGNKAIDDPQEKLKARLTSILAMTKSSNEAEAGQAAALLQKFLTEHNLSVADLEMRGKAAPGMRKDAHDLGKAAFAWKLDLADGIAEFYYCAPLVDRRTKSVAFVGRPENVESLTMLYGWVIDQIKAIATIERRVYFDRTQEHIDPLRWQLNFGTGAVERLIDRLREMKTRQAEGMSRDELGNVTALAIHHQAEVSDWLEEHYGYRTDGKKTKRELKNEAYWEKWEKDREDARIAKDNLKIQCTEAGDLAPFYAQYPDEHPDAIAKAAAEREQREKEYERKEKRNAKRRTGSSWRSEKETDWTKVDQSDSARAAGREAAAKVNLQPFVGGDDPKRKKVGGG
jgi:hypothetical protein